MLLPFLLSLSLLLHPHNLILQPTNPSDVRVDSYPRVIMAGGTIRIRAVILPDPRNRRLIVEWYFAEGFENRKFYQLDGAQRQKTFEHSVRLKESGEWTVRAVLERNDQTKKVAMTTVRVTGGAEDGQSF